MLYFCICYPFFQAVKVSETTHCASTKSSNTLLSHLSGFFFYSLLYLHGIPWTNHLSRSCIDVEISTHLDLKPSHTRILCSAHYFFLPAPPTSLILESTQPTKKRRYYRIPPNHTFHTPGGNQRSRRPLPNTSWQSLRYLNYNILLLCSQ